MLKRWLIRRQREWAEALAARISKIKPPAIHCQASGWAPECVPILEFRRLEWVNVTLDLGGGRAIGNEYHYPDEPTDDEIVRDCRRLIEMSYRMGVGLAAAV